MLLTRQGDGSEAPMVMRSLSDPGDSVEYLRPSEGNVENWVTCHDLNNYIDLLSKLRAPGDEEVELYMTEDVETMEDYLEWGDAALGEAVWGI